jgi:hypothetical protein
MRSRKSALVFGLFQIFTSEVVTAAAPKKAKHTGKQLTIAVQKLLDTTGNLTIVFWSILWGKLT